MGRLKGRWGGCRASSASCFIFRARARHNGRRGTCAHILAHTRGTVNIYEATFGSGGWKDEKSLANLRRALCRSTKSGIHRECVMRLLETYVRPPRAGARLRHPRHVCASCLREARVLLFPSSMKLTGRDLEIDRKSCSRAERSSNGPSIWREIGARSEDYYFIHT